MKAKKLIVSLICIAACVGAVIAVITYSGHKPFKSLQVADITAASVVLSPPNKKVEIPKADLAELVTDLKEVVVYQKEDSYEDAEGQSATFVLTQADGSTIEIMIFTPSVVINGVGYKAKYEPCNALNGFANRVLKQADDDDVIDTSTVRGNLNNRIRVSEDVSKNVPFPVLQCAEAYLVEIIDDWDGSTVTDNVAVAHVAQIAETRITGLTKMDTGTEGLTSGNQLWLLEYRLRFDDPDSIALDTGMQMEMIDGENWLTEWCANGQPYLLLHWESDGMSSSWERTCVIFTEQIDSEYGTPAMIEKYGNKYTAVAAEIQSSEIELYTTPSEDDVLALREKVEAGKKGIPNRPSSELVMLTADAQDWFAMPEPTGHKWTVWYNGRVECKGYGLDEGDSFTFSGFMADSKMDELWEILNTDFQDYTEGIAQISDGTGWAITLFDITGKEIHQFYGYIEEIPALERLAEILYGAKENLSAAEEMEH